ncbi:ogr/Delta-like zinc finger family protein [Crenobacter sp. SG2303]|uniref:Ogr/Delta-like zinc finger family protein n=1 Tax=Crenobacter oryzisoli TaxID=3056844 RepID=A0ABT7XPA4_9NEIS|nr:ogr/Delta-like zinc finger family protein [Crenobacter sp. SG2303]MDN0075618.1 ogr/Delta-like zinc finger family protein [Crenobacter sp. SG2303]
MAFTCPHCGAIANTRTSRMMSAKLREARHQCSDLECGHTFATLTEVVRTLSPSAKPNPLVFIPYGKKAQPPDDRQLDLLADTAG